MAELRPCPFCGGKAKSVARQMRFFGQNYIGQKKIRYGQQIMCQKCHARGPLFSRIVILPSEEHKDAFAWLEENAATAWNRRTDNG